MRGGMEKPQSPGIKKGASYPKEFREEAVRYWLSSGKKASLVAQELGVSDWSLSRWRQELEESNGAPAADTSQVNALELAKENGRLRRENEALLRQREVLKRLSASSPRKTPSEVRGDRDSHSASASGPDRA